MTKHKRPVGLPMRVSNIIHLKLNKDGYWVIDHIKRETMERVRKQIFFGKGLPLYRCDLCFISGNPYDTLFIRGRSKQDALKRLKAQYPSIEI
jgi:hypothetical protein